MRYMAKVLKTTLEKKFPNATERDIYKASVVSFATSKTLLCLPMIPKQTG
jgi:hypothetical protein